MKKVSRIGWQAAAAATTRGALGARGSVIRPPSQARGHNIENNRVTKAVRNKNLKQEVSFRNHEKEVLRGVITAKGVYCHKRHTDLRTDKKVTWRMKMIWATSEDWPTIFRTIYSFWPLIVSVWLKGSDELNWITSRWSFKKHRTPCTNQDYLTTSKLNCHPIIKDCQSRDEIRTSDKANRWKTLLCHF